MNVYDFDGTIFYPNCSVAFLMWCLKRHPGLWFTYAPKAARDLIRYKRGKIAQHRFLRGFFGFLGKVDDFDAEIERFWDKKEKNISEWYLAQRRPDDIIISGSPSCIIAPIAKRLGVGYVATEYDREHGVYLDDLMMARSKARHVIENDFPVIENFYSDSLSDTPIALCAEKAHLVTNKARKVTDWPHLDAKTLKKVRKEIDTGWTINI